MSDGRLYDGFVPGAIRSMPMAMAASASPTCPIAARSWLFRRGSGRGRSTSVAELTDEALDPIFAEGDALELLLLGTGARHRGHSEPRSARAFAKRGSAST